jgi:adenosine deaminase
MEDHNIVELLRKGVAVTINSDDPAYFGGYMSDNFNAVSQAHEMTHQELAQFTLNAIDASFIEESLKQQYRKLVQGYLSKSDTE